MGGGAPSFGRMSKEEVRPGGGGGEGDLRSAGLSLVGGSLWSSSLQRGRGELGDRQEAGALLGSLEITVLGL